MRKVRVGWKGDAEVFWRGGGMLFLDKDKEG